MTIILRNRFWKPVGIFPDYASAVREGQQLYGHGAFSVDTGSRVPSREEQLLTAKPKTKTKTERQRILEEL